MKRDEPIIVKTAQLAIMLALSERRVQQLREAGMPRIRHGTWDLMAVIPWYMEYIEKHANPKDKTSEEAQRRYYLARAGLTEHKEAEAKGQAVSLAEHKAIVSELCADLAAEIESFPLREYTQPDERDTAFRICYRLRERLAGSALSSRDVDREGGGEPLVGAATEPERKPVGGRVQDATAP